MRKSYFLHPITEEFIEMGIDDFADLFYEKIINPFKEKTGLEVNGWNDAGISVGILKDDGCMVRLPLWFVKRILNDWKSEEGDKE
jgi:hypothetical protein